MKQDYESLYQFVERKGKEKHGSVITRWSYVHATNRHFVLLSHRRNESMPHPMPHTHQQNVHDISPPAFLLRIFLSLPRFFFFSSSHSSTRRSNVSKRITDDGKVSRGGKLLQTFFVHPFNARRSKIVILLSFSWRRVLSLSLFFKRSHSRLEKEKETRVSLIMIHIIRLEYFVSSAY